MKPRQKFKEHSHPFPSKAECYKRIKQHSFWERISNRHDLTVDFIREFQDQLYWLVLCGNSNLVMDNDFLEEFSDKLNWYYISTYKCLEPADLRRFKDKLIWDSITRNQKLSEEDIIEFADKVDWKFIYNQKLSMNLIRRYWNKLDPESVVEWCQLDEDFIEDHWKEFVPYINMICRRQKLTANFIWKHIDILDIGAMAENGKIAPYLREKFQKCVNKGYVPDWRDRWYKYLYNNCNDLFVKFHNLRNPDIKEILGLM